MRIALVSPHAPGRGTAPGPVPGMVALAQALARLEHDVTVYARKDSPGLPAEATVPPGVRVVHVDAGPAASMPVDDLAPHIRPLGEFLARSWEQDRPDLAHAYSWPGGLAALAGARDLGIPVAVTFHELAVQGSLLRLRQAREQLARVKLKISLARSVSTVLARSSEEMSVLAGLGVPRAAIRVVPWGVDTAHFGPGDQAAAGGPPAARAARRGARRRLLTAWPGAAQHRLDALLRALADIPRAELVVMGGPPRGELAGSKVYRELVRLAGRMQVADRVTFTGAVAWQDLPGLLRSADLMISTSPTGFFDGTALQAMACGTALVAPATGFYADLVVDGTTGILVPPGRASGLARRIRRLLDSPVQLEALGIAAADRARSRYAWDRIAREAAHAYTRCLPAPVAAETADDAVDELAAEPVAGLAEALSGS